MRTLSIMRQRSTKIKMKAVSATLKYAKTATIVSDDSKDDEVGIDDIVEVYFEEDDEIQMYELSVNLHRGNSMENHINYQSPIGMALKGHKVGTIWK